MPSRPDLTTFTRRRILAAALGAAAAPFAACDNPSADAATPRVEPQPAWPQRARWALVLSGAGCAVACAHLGVLRALRRLQCEPGLVERATLAMRSALRALGRNDGAFADAAS